MEGAEGERALPFGLHELPNVGLVTPGYVAAFHLEFDEGKKEDIKPGELRKVRDPPGLPSFSRSGEGWGGMRLLWDAPCIGHRGSLQPWGWAAVGSSAFCPWKQHPAGGFWPPSLPARQFGRMEHNRSLPREVLTFVHAGPAGKHRAAVENIGACRMRGVGGEKCVHVLGKQAGDWVVAWGEGSQAGEGEQGIAAESCRASRG